MLGCFRQNTRSISPEGKDTYIWLLHKKIIIWKYTINKWKKKPVVEEVMCVMLIIEKNTQTFKDPLEVKT